MSACLGVLQFTSSKSSLSVLDFEADLNVKSSEFNHDVIAFHGKDITKNGLVLDFIEVQALVPDLDDWHLWNANLSQDRSSFILEKPIQPSVLVKNYEEIYATSTAPRYEQIQNLHSVTATAILNRPPEKNTRKSIYSFPNGIQCTNSHFNDGVSDDLKLHKYISKVVKKHEIGKASIENTYVVAIWRMSILGKERAMATGTKKEIDDLANMFAGM